MINALISSPEDLDFRMHLRNEFMRVGLIDVLEVSWLGYLMLYYPDLCFSSWKMIVGKSLSSNSRFLLITRTRILTSLLRGKTNAFSIC